MSTTQRAGPIVDGQPGWGEEGAAMYGRIARFEAIRGKEADLTNRRSQQIKEMVRPAE